jgi:phosphoglycolate phosphatase
MFLDKFNRFDEIYIQCHDNPDADAMASGFALYSYFCDRGKEVRLVYSGSNRITKPSLLLMIQLLDIPIEYVETSVECPVLVTVDCQYEGGNITGMKAERVAMVDHHPCCVAADEWCEIRKNYGSCCTVVWELLKEQGYDVNRSLKLATALYYGLYSDTGQLSEIYLQPDRALRDYLKIDRVIMDRIVNSNLSRHELQIAGEALSAYHYDGDYSFAVVKTRPCDPNLLGVINDLMIQADTINLSIVYSEMSIGYKFSVRSNLNEARAGEVARYISEGLGSGGGHVNKAGGFILKKLFEQQYSGEDFEKTLCHRIRQYHRSCGTI